MPSSISNSNARIRSQRWKPILLGGALFATCVVGILEALLALRGFGPRLPDSIYRWELSRAKASEFGDRALILVGNSRMQLDLDLSEIEKSTGLRPVQLAISGERTFEPELQALANDPTIRGTLLVSYVNDAPSAFTGGWNRARAYEAQYRWFAKEQRWTFQRTEPVLDDFVRSSLRSYSDGGTPLTSLRTRILSATPLPQFVTTLPDRSQFADFSKVRLPDYYFKGVQRWLSTSLPIPTDGNYAALNAQLTELVGGIEPVDNTKFLEQLPHIQTLVSKIEARGAKVIFVNLPSSGLIHEMEARAFPRNLYWDNFVASISAQTLNVDDISELSQFRCPDGSHLDVRQKSAFTDALMRALNLAKNSGH